MIIETSTSGKITFKATTPPALTCSACGLVVGRTCSHEEVEGERCMDCFARLLNGLYPVGQHA